MSIVSQHYFIFLALLLPLYYFTAEASRWKVLLFASFVFYLFSGTSFYIVFILLTTLSTFFLGKWIDCMAEKTKYKLHTEVLEKEEKKRLKKELKKKQGRILLIGLFFNFGILAILKYTNFVIENVNALLYQNGSEQQFSMMNWIFPLGISYYTFQAMGYLIDLYRGKSSAEKSLPRFALFCVFFRNFLLDQSVDIANSTGVCLQAMLLTLKIFVLEHLAYFGDFSKNWSLPIDCRLPFHSLLPIRRPLTESTF